MLTITLLGTAATMPLPDRALSAAFAACGGHGLLWDCGEGTQAAARRAGVNLMRADAICLSYIKETFILLFTMAGACLIVFLVPGLFVLFPESSAASPAI